MQTLNTQEIETVTGGALPAGTAMKITLGLMALALGSPIVMGVGCAALVTHAFVAAMRN